MTTDKCAATTAEGKHGDFAEKNHVNALLAVNIGAAFTECAGQEFLEWFIDVFYSVSS